MQTVTVAGGNLFALAAAQYNDATQWIALAQANNLQDPQLSGVVTLLVPATNPSLGGIPSQ